MRSTLAILGGSGAEGSGLALRWAHAGHAVIVGSRDPARAAGIVDGLNARHAGPPIQVRDNLAAAAAGDIVVLTVPYSAQLATVTQVRDALAGKILVDATVPLVPPKVNRVQLPEGGCAVEAVQALLGPQVRVVSAFQNVSAHLLKDLAHVIDCDVLVCGDDATARETVIALARDLGLRGVHAGPLCNSAAAEALTSILISINRTYKASGAGIRITGVPALESGE